MNNDMLNNNNWNNLIQLYDNAASHDSMIQKKTEPILCYRSDCFGWPNFTLIEPGYTDIEALADLLDFNIMQGLLSPFILIHPDYNKMENLSEAFNTRGIRQIDEWTGISYDTSWGIPYDAEISNFRIEEVTGTENAEIWHKLVSNLMFKDQILPMEVLANENHVLLLGFENEAPIATVMLYLDENNSAGTYMGVVHPDYRFKGYGKKIHSEAVRIAIEKNRGFVYGQSTRRGLKAWLSIGFKSTGAFPIYWKVDSNKKII